MREGQPKKQEAPHESAESPYASERDMLISEQLHEFLNLKPEELRTELKSMIERIRALEEMSRTDELTGLLNRRGFLEEVKRFEALFERERSRAQVETPNALLAIDLDGFKEVNDTVGHAAGDRCLQIIAQEVKAALRESDIFARIGGDEFGIFLSQINEQDAIAVARKVRGVIEGVVSETLRNEFPAYAGTLSASIGVLPLTSHDGMKIEDQQRYADYAAYVVKAAGKNGEVTLDAARELDADGTFEKDFLTGKTLPR